jgi:hypothetical protein
MARTSQVVSAPIRTERGGRNGDGGLRACRARGHPRVRRQLPVADAGDLLRQPGDRNDLRIVPSDLPPVAAAGRSNPDAGLYGPYLRSSPRVGHNGRKLIRSPDDRHRPRFLVSELPDLTARNCLALVHGGHAMTNSSGAASSRKRNHQKQAGNDASDPRTREGSVRCLDKQGASHDEPDA